jgi:hypothetical protein
MHEVDEKVQLMMSCEDGDILLSVSNRSKVKSRSHIHINIHTPPQETLLSHCLISKRLHFTNAFAVNLLCLFPR